MSYNIVRNGSLVPIAGNTRPSSSNPDIAEEEYSPAQSAHAAGEYFYYNESLYKTLTIINIGDNLIKDSNIEKVNVTNELESKVDTETLNSRLSDIDTAFTGTNGITAGTQGMVPAPAITDANKVLKSDGTWGNVPSSGHVIVDEDGVSYPYRNKLKFENSEVEDDSLHDITIVSPRGGVNFDDIITELDEAIKDGNINDTLVSNGGDIVVSSGGDTIGSSYPISQDVIDYFTCAYYTALILSGESLVTVAQMIDS